MFSRRDFLFSAAGGMVTAAAAMPAGMGASGGAPAGVMIGCQTNAWRINPQDFDQVLGVLRRLKELGFDGFETSFRNVQGQFGDAAGARRKIEAVGLRFLGCHIFLDQYDTQTMVAPMDMVKTVADGAASLGAQRLILSGGGLIRDGKVDQEALKRKAEGLNAAGRYAKSKGLRLAYHNHGPEFEKGGLEIEGLYRLTDPGLVDFLTDCGWAFRTGIDVPGFFTRHHKRIIGMHLRDFKAGTQVPLGQGDFPLKEVAAAVKKANWSGWVINEEERLSGEKPGEKAVAPARESLRQSFGR